MRKNSIFILIFVLMGCSGEESPTINLEKYKLKNHNSRIEELLFENKITIQESDSIIIFDSRSCISCMRYSYEEKIFNLDRQNVDLLVFTTLDSSYFSSRLDATNVFVVKESRLEFKLNVPYIYNFEDGILNGTPL